MEITNSAILEIDSRDFILGSDKLETIDPEIREWRSRYIIDHQYNQKLVDDYSCTTHASVWVLSDFLWQKLTINFIEKVFNRQKDTTFVPWVWDYFSNWIKQACKEWNASSNIENWIEYFRIELTEEKIKSIITGVWSSIVAWYTWSLRADAEDNGYIDNPDNKDWGGHCIRIWKWFYNDKNEFCIKYIDNYKGVVKYNIITIEEFNKNKDFYPYGYYIQPKKESL